MRRKAKRRKQILESWRFRAQYGVVVKCGICGRPIDITSRRNGLTVDHIVPKSLGGAEHPYNYQPAHSKCNRRKGNIRDYKPRLANAH